MEIGASWWAEKVEELVLQTWRVKMNKNSHWDIIRDIKDWRRGVLLATTSGYHNLVLWWNVRTLLQEAGDLSRAMEIATYHLMDDKATDLSVMLLTSERSSRR